MKKEIKLHVVELESLKTEILGTNSESKGLIHESLDILTKYNLQVILREIDNHLSPIESLKEKRIQELGELNHEGNYIISIVDKNNQRNPNYDIFIQEMNELYNQEITINYTPIKLSKISNITTTNTLYVLYKLIEDDTNE